MSRKTACGLVFGVVRSVWWGGGGAPR
ncbi:MAG: hypothetical protein QOJ19_4981, partial [Acidimicrobiia bacterium]|nr:hypothetical protein [Acidimicrobiia bacterium]